MKRILIAAAFLLLPSAALPHDWYSGIKNAQGLDCCSANQDCAPIAVEEVSGGWRMTQPFTGLRVFVAYRDAMPSQDDHFHACWYPLNSPAPRCFFSPGGV